MSNDVSFSMSIGGIGVRFRSSNLVLIGNLEKRYSVFKGKGSPEAIIDIVVDERWEGEILREQEQYIGSTQYTSRTGNTQGDLNFIDDSGVLVISKHASIAEMEYFIRGLFAVLGFKYGSLMIHSAGIVRDDNAFIFMGHSGSGKSTISQLSKDYVILNDDLLLIKKENNRWVAYSTPFWNPGIYKDVNLHAPINSLYDLVQDTDVYLQTMEKSIAVAEIISNVPVIPLNSDFMVRLIDRCDAVLDQITMYSLHFRKDSSFWGIIHPD